jgi:hypothetical protein
VRGSAGFIRRFLPPALFFGLIATSAAWSVGPPLVGCSIKGNISYVTGERIYHMPGQEFYDATIINPLKGERWFCSEEEAQAAGWRRARDGLPEVVRFH